MKLTRIFSLALVLVLVATATLVLAQDDPELEEYESADGKFTVMMPAGWFAVGEDEEVPFPTATFVNTEDGLERYETDIDPLPGDAAILILLLPADFLPFLGVELMDDSGPADLVEVMAAAFLEPEEGSDDEAEIGEAEEVELAEDVVAGYVEVSDPTSDGAFVVHQPAEDIIALTFLVAAPGEFTEDLSELGLAVAATIAYDGTGADLMAAMMGGALDEGMDDEGEGDDAMGATLDGATLVDTRCTTCHTADRIMNADKDVAGWTATVDRMIGYGAQLNADERQALIDYLVATY